MAVVGDSRMPPPRVHVNNVQYTQTHNCNNGTNIVIGVSELKLNTNLNWRGAITITIKFPETFGLVPV